MIDSRTSFEQMKGELPWVSRKSVPVKLNFEDDLSFIDRDKKSEPVDEDGQVLIHVPSIELNPNSRYAESLGKVDRLRQMIDHPGQVSANSRESSINT